MFSSSSSSSSMVPKTTLSSVAEAMNLKLKEEEQEDPAEEIQNHMISSHVYIKPTHTSQTLDKDQVLRRIRQRKRANKVRTALQAFLTSPFSSNSSDHHQKRWVDDAFAAP